MFTARSGNPIQFDPTLNLKGNSPMRHMYKNIISIINNDSVMNSALSKWKKTHTKTTQYFSRDIFIQIF